VCSSAGHGTLATFNGAPLNWTQYQYNFTAYKTAHTIMFGFTSDSSGQRAWFLDTVSVVAFIVNATELIQNPGFENSSTTLTDWTQYCTNTCLNGSATAGQVYSSANSSNNFYVDHCYGVGAIDFLSQTFPTTIGHLYRISFRILDYGSGPDGASNAYVDIY